MKGTRKGNGREREKEPLHLFVKRSVQGLEGKRGVGEEERVGKGR
jgi:hypothetical protein